MMPAHFVVPIGASEVAQAFELDDSRISELEASAEASGFRVGRYVHKGAKCYAILDTSERVYAVNFGGIRSRIVHSYAWSPALRRLMAAFDSDCKVCHDFPTAVHEFSIFTAICETRRTWLRPRATTPLGRTGPRALGLTQSRARR